jgi:hypothetical protein
MPRERRRATLRAAPKSKPVTATDRNRASAIEAEKRIARIEGDVSAFAKAMRVIRREWVGRLTELVLAPNVIENARQIDRIATLQAQVREQLTVIGYDRLAQTFLDDSFASARAGAAAAVEVTGLTATAEALRAIPGGALGILRALNLKELGDIGTSTISAIVGSVTRNAIAGTPRRVIIEDIQTQADKFAGHASTYADTALSVYDRTVHEQAFKAAGVDQWLYMGPKDAKNREFCARHAGKTYTTAEVAKLDNGTKLMPVSKYGGGWNCRHILIPFFE